jgi:hypothetical protein
MFYFDKYFRDFVGADRRNTRCDSPDQVTHYDTLGPNLGASSLTRHKADFGLKAIQFSLLTVTFNVGNKKLSFPVLNFIIIKMLCLGVASQYLIYA